MKTSKNILIAFLLNITFSIIEFISGILTNSVAITSDAIHDLSDAISIGISYFLERKSNKKPDKKYTYGYTRYSVLGALITNTILITGSILVIISAIKRLINPVNVNYDGMIIIAIFGVIINLIAAYITKEKENLNQKAVNLHMLEDVLGWIVVLIGSILIKFTKINTIDSIMSILVSSFILIHAIKSLKEILDLFLEKVPVNIKIEELKNHINKINEIEDIHHIHIWSMDGINNYATMHIVTKSKNIKKLKHEIREECQEHNINHVTIEIEEDNDCENTECHINKCEHHHHH